MAIQSSSPRTCPLSAETVVFRLLATSAASSPRALSRELGFGGTSSSCPKVAGVVALMLSANPQLTPNEVKSILQKSADDIDAPGYDDKTGAGRVNAYKAVQMAQAKTEIEHHQEQPLNHNRQYEAFDNPGQNPNQPNPSPPASRNNWQSVVE